MKFIQEVSPTTTAESMGEKQTPCRVRQLQKSLAPYSSVMYNISLIITIFLIIFLASQIGDQLSTRHDDIYVKNSVPQDEEEPCGKDAIAARARGCNFDPLTFAWLPPRCYDYNLTAEFIGLQDWEWYRKRPDGSKRRLSLINVMQGNDVEIYVSWDYHRQHCNYMYLKMHRAMMSTGDKWIDGVTMWDIMPGVCDGVFRSKRDLNDTSVQGYIRFPSCKKY
jgi:hypothetical protein